MPASPQSQKGALGAYTINQVYSAKYHIIPSTGGQLNYRDFFFFLLQRKNTNLDSNTYRDPRIHSCAEQVTDAREMGWLLPTFLSIKPEACHLQEAAWSCVSRGRTGASPSIHNSLPMNYPLGFPPLT